MDNKNLYNLSKLHAGEETSKDVVDKTYNRIKYLYENINNEQKFGFEINKFSENEQKLFLLELDKIRGSESGFFNTKAQKFPNRRILDNLQKEDMDLELENLIDYFIEIGSEDNNFKLNLLPFQDVVGIDYYNKEMIKQSIRYSGDNCTKSYEEPYKSILNYANSVSVELDNFKNIGIRNLKQEMLVVNLIEESFTYLFLQSLIYRIIKNPNLKKDERLKYLLRINEVLKTVYDDESLECDECENIFNSFAIYLFKLRKRNEMYNYIDVIKVLENEMNEHQDIFKNVQDEFKCNKRWISEIETKKELMNIILEGEKEKVERFNKKIEKCKKIMRILRITAGRDLSEDYLQHIKVVYREIFLSKIKYNDKNANTIVKSILGEKEFAVFSSEKESLFLREKINRGFFREDGLIEEYRLKNNIQKQLYEILLKIYSNMNLGYQRSNIIRLYEKVSLEMLLIFKEIDERFRF